MTIDILVFVNGDFHNDPRVNRAVRFMGQFGYQLIVASGLTKGPIPSPKDYEWGRVHYLRVFKAGQISWSLPFTRFAETPSKKTNSKSSETIGSQPSWYKRLFKSLLYLSQLLNFLQLNLRLIIRYYRLDVKLYYPNDIDVAVAAAVLAWIHKKPLLYETHEFHVDQSAAHPAWYRRVIMALEGWVAKRSTNMIVVGNCIAQAIRRQYQLDTQPVVIKNCPPFQQVTKSSDIELPFKLLYHGVYQPKRGLEQVILAMHHIDEAHLYLRGYGYWEKPLHNLVTAEDLEDRVTFFPPVPMQTLVTEAAPFDVGVGAFQGVNLSSRYCLPNKVFEYMMAGLALAVSDLPELHRVVDDYGVGVTFDPADPEDIARKINSMLDNPDVLHQMQRRSLKAAREVFNFEAEGKKLQKIVEDIIGLPTPKN
ncbi:MAG: glycosyltransferase family 4 protein [Deltaproteobacteria bacterium]|nr:glycosyltransferase family 4 protein [Deltaproteobacteria bacterium]